VGFLQRTVSLGGNRHTCPQEPQQNENEYTTSPHRTGKTPGAPERNALPFPHSPPRGKPCSPPERKGKDPQKEKSGQDEISGGKEARTQQGRVSLSRGSALFSGAWKGSLRRSRSVPQQKGQGPPRKTATARLRGVQGRLLPATEGRRRRTTTSSKEEEGGCLSSL